MKKSERYLGGGMRILVPAHSPLGVLAASALLLIAFFRSPSAAADDKADTAVSLVVEVLAVRNEAGKITQVRLIRADGRYLRVELDAQGAFLGVTHSGSFVEVVGQVYVKLNQAEQIRWIRVQRFRPVPRPTDWVEPELICHEVDAEPDVVEEEEDEDAGVEDESDQ